MNLGKTILELRKAKNVTQEDMAAELGVTAAAVSKWENDYTLPDILMLCAIADYFEVTTDELLGRKHTTKKAMLVTTNPEIMEKLPVLAQKYNISVTDIQYRYADAVAQAKDGSVFDYFLIALPEHITEEDRVSRIADIEVHSEGGTTEDILGGFEMYFKNMEAFHALAPKKH